MIVQPPGPIGPVNIQYPQCRVCGHYGLARMESRATTAAWILTVGLGVTICGLLFCWIPLLFMRERFAICANCRTRL